MLNNQILFYIKYYSHLKSFPGHTASSSGEVRWRTTIVLADSIDLADGVHSNWGSEIFLSKPTQIFSDSPPDVDVSGDGSASNIEPIWIKGSLEYKNTIIESWKEKYFSLTNSLPTLVLTMSTHSGTFILPDFLR